MSSICEMTLNSSNRMAFKVVYVNTSLDDFIIFTEGPGAFRVYTTLEK